MLVVAVLPDGREYFDNACYPLQFAIDVVEKLGITRLRDDKPTICVLLFEIVAREGQLMRKEIGFYDVSIPIREMTNNEYQEALNKKIEKLPKEFYEFAFNYMYIQEGSYEKRLEIAEKFITDLQSAIKEYLCYTRAVYDKRDSKNYKVRT